MRYYLKSHYQCGETIRLDDEDFDLLQDAADRATHLSMDSMAYGNVMVIDSETDAVVAEYSSGKKLQQRQCYAIDKKETIASDLRRIASLHPRNSSVNLQDTIRMIVDKCIECAKGGHFNTTVTLGLRSIEEVEEELKARGFRVKIDSYGDGHILEIKW